MLCLKVCCNLLACYFHFTRIYAQDKELNAWLQNHVKLSFAGKKSFKSKPAASIEENCPVFYFIPPPPPTTTATPLPAEHNGSICTLQILPKFSSVITDTPVQNFSPEQPWFVGFLFCFVCFMIFLMRKGESLNHMWKILGVERYMWHKITWYEES